MDAKEIYDEVSALKDIADRERMIRNYQCTGGLDRVEAISKIKELRAKDPVVAVVTVPKVAANSIPLECASDVMLVEELEKQKKLLEAKVVEKQMNR